MCIDVSIYSCIAYICIRMYVRTYMHMYIHTYIHAYILTYTYDTAQMQLHSQVQVSNKVRYRFKATSHSRMNNRMTIVTRKSMLAMLLLGVIDCRFTYILLDACSYVRV